MMPVTRFAGSAWACGLADGTLEPAGEAQPWATTVILAVVL